MKLDKQESLAVSPEQMFRVHHHCHLGPGKQQIWMMSMTLKLSSLLRIPMPFSLPPMHCLKTISDDSKHWIRGMFITALVGLLPP